jgi:hypothetical protein
MGVTHSRDFNSAKSPPMWCLAIMKYQTKSERFNMITLNRSFASFGADPLFARQMCLFLKNEGYYVPLDLPLSERNWKSFYQELLSMRLWGGAAGLTDEEAEAKLMRGITSQKETTNRFKVNVYARFRPFDEKKALHEATKEKDELASSPSSLLSSSPKKQCVLPLHQRLNMIRMSGSATTRREALKVLASEGDWFGEKYKKMQEKQQRQYQQQKEQNIKSAIHINDENNNISIADCETPSLLTGEKKLVFTKKLKRDPIVSRVQSVDSGMASVVMIAPDVGLREFTFDGVVEGSSDNDHKQQTRSYNLMCKRLVVDFLNGYNATCIAYGQTASGKTYTMLGPEDVVHTTTNNYVNSLKNEKIGIIPRACMEVLSCVQDDNRTKMGIFSELSISYVEIYGNYVCDLLKGGKRVGHSKVASQRFVLSGAMETAVTDIADVYSALKTGDTQRRRAATAMNDRSSRAHALVILTLNQTYTKTGESKKSRLFLADLGGSEKVQKSKIDSGVSRTTGQESEFSQGFQLGDRMREAVYINLGLLALKRCIEALNESSCYVPYQDSKLTMLLSAGLGGDCKTSVIICNSMDPTNAIETMSTLRFGERCALVENEAKNQASVLAGVLKKLDANIAELEAAIVAKERWVHSDVVRKISMPKSVRLSHKVWVV